MVCVVMILVSRHDTAEILLKLSFNFVIFSAITISFFLIKKKLLIYNGIKILFLVVKKKDPEYSDAWSL